MSVLKNHRHKAPTEYERKFDMFARYLDNRIKRVPMRHYKEIISPFNDAIIRCENDIADMTHLFLNDKRYSAAWYRSVLSLINNMNDIAKMSYTFWNISETKASIKLVKNKSREYWANSFNEVLLLIYEEAKKCQKFKEGDVELVFMFPYPNYKKAKYVSEIAKIHKIVYYRSKHMNGRWKDRNIEQFLELSADALYNAYNANMVEIVDKKTQHTRVQFLNNTIDLLYKMDKPLRELAFDHVFTEKELEIIHNSLTESKKMTQAIRNDNKQLLFE